MAVLSTIATALEITVAAASLANMGYSAAQGAPKIPGGASASREIAQAQANALPEQRDLAALEQQGGEGTRTIAAHKEKQKVTEAMIPGVNGQPDIWVPYHAADWQEGGKYFDKLGGWTSPQTRSRNIKLKVPESTQPISFKGFGTADIEGEMARKMADIQGELGKKYGVKFAEEAAREAAQADPQGTAARNREYDMIEKEIANPRPINPLSTSLESGIDAQLKAGSGLDAMSKDLLNAAVSRSNAARGGGVAAGDVEQSMSTGDEGEARRRAAEGKAQAFLSSGSTPEDIEFKREQQNLHNLGAFVGGQTPESQFQNLSGASQGAAPMYPGQPLPSQPTNAAALGGPYSVAAYSAKTSALAGEANPWMSGLSTLLSAGSTAAKFA